MDSSRVRELVSGRTPGPARSPSPGPPGGLAVVAVAAGVLLAGAACLDTEFGPTDPGLAAQIDILFEVPGASSTSSSVGEGLVAGNVTVSQNDTTLVIDSVDVSIRELQLGREGTTCEFGSVGTTGDGGDGTDCEEASVQTVLQTLPVDEGTVEILSGGLVEPGTLDRFAFRLNVLEGGTQEEIAILSDADHMRDASIFVSGTFEGSDFSLTLDPDQEVVVEAGSPLTLDTEETGRAVLVWNVAEWFVDPDDGGLEDPDQVASDAMLEQQVEDRILATLEARMTK